jgi:hypothetical protein
MEITRKYYPRNGLGSSDKLYHIMLYWVHLAWEGFKLTMLEVIGTDCTGSYKSNYHTIIGIVPIHVSVKTDFYRENKIVTNFLCTI